MSGSREKGSLSSVLLGSAAISLAEGKVPSKKASSWFSRLADRLRMGSKELGGAICTWGGGRDTTVLTGIVVMLAVTGLILEIGEGSSVIVRQISAKYHTQLVSKDLLLFKILIHY